MTASELIALLQDLVQLMTQSSLTVDDVVNHLGQPGTDEYGQAIIDADNEAIGWAMVVAGEDSEEPSFVQLTFKEGLPAEAVHTAFGESHEPPRIPNLPPRAIFYVNPPGQSHSAAVIADIQDGEVKTVTIRRDIRLG
jgi:hypothetical protein